MIQLQSAYLSFLVINHDIVRLDISVHDAFAVAEVQGFEQLVYVVSHIVVLEFGIKTSKVGVVDVFKN